LVEEERQAGLAIELMVDGSFVTDKPEPNDIDLVIVLSAGYNRGAGLAPFRYNAISKAQIRRKYSFDVFVVNEQSDEYRKRGRFLSRSAVRSGQAQRDSET
jgi:hypothetical protein